MHKIENEMLSRIEVSGEGVDEIMGKTPGWILKWGISIIFSSIMVFVLLASIIRIPDTIDTKIEIVQQTGPVNIVSTQSGILVAPNIITKNYTGKGDTLAVIKTLKIDNKKNIKINNEFHSKYVKGSNEIEIVKSPAEGDLCYSSRLMLFNNVAEKETLCTIIPRNNISPVALFKIHEMQVGKIKRGQKVLITLNKYPSSEYGKLRGVIKWISEFPEENYYPGIIEFERKIILKNADSIRIIHGMSGTAEIITEDKSIISRIFTSNIIK